MRSRRALLVISAAMLSAVALSPASAIASPARADSPASSPTILGDGSCPGYLAPPSHTNSSITKPPQFLPSVDVESSTLRIRG